MGGTEKLPLDHTTYILSGLIPWLCFQNSISKGCSAIINHANLVKQCVFPIEVLPIKSSLSSLLAFSIGLSFIFIYTCIKENTIYKMYLLLPIIIFIQALTMIGTSFILAAFSVFIKDVKDFMQLFITINIFLMPIIYLPESVPSIFKFIFNINPFSHIIWVYQDILYFGRFEHPTSWLFFLFGGPLWFVFGYRVFSKLRQFFGNYL